MEYGDETAGRLRKATGSSRCCGQTTLAVPVICVISERLA